MTDLNQHDGTELAPRVYKLEGEVAHLASSMDSLSKLVRGLGDKIDNLTTRGRVQPSIIISTGALIIGIVATLSAFVVYTSSSSLAPVDVRVKQLEQSVTINNAAIIELLQRTSNEK